MCGVGGGPQDAMGGRVIAHAGQTNPRVVVAKHEYTGTAEGDLNFVAGERIEVLKETASGWWKGKIGDRQGVFPVNFTMPAEELPPA